MRVTPCGQKPLSQRGDDTFSGRMFYVYAIFYSLQCPALFLLMHLTCQAFFLVSLRVFVCWLLNVPEAC